MKNHLIIGLKITLITLVLFGVLYPLFVTLIAKIVGQNGGRGQEVITHGSVVGFELIGQKFDTDRYFNGRPSAVNYNAAGTGGSNKGPTNPEYLAQVKARIDTFMVHNPGIVKSQIPVDMVTASGSGLDPHISPSSAMIQVDRIARHRKLKRETVIALVENHIERPIMGMGTSRINVLRLNIALDELK